MIKFSTVFAACLATLVFCFCVQAQEQKLAIEFRLVVDDQQAIDRDTDKVQTKEGPIYVETNSRITEADIDTVTIVDFENPHILLRMTDKGREKFYQMTQKFIGRRMAIFVDDIYMMAPVIEIPIEHGQVAITAPSRTEFERIVDKLDAPYQIREKKR